MSKPSSRVPAYRITLFYGPEYVDGSLQVIQCVFNVKKRSWKGGVQVVVDVEESQFQRIQQSLQFSTWLENMLAQLPEESRHESETRAKDLFAQQVCLTKLQLAIQQGIHQENTTVGRDRLVQELDELSRHTAESIKQHVLEELDIQAIFSQDAAVEANGLPNTLSNC
ncbi:MAG: hypothetical protein MRJ96_04850 [Nitrospirales bacterium]|nr:hypothetical protein [Nitrospira sp.]MDR4500769.1 hypothetical protein [Nitrospirales bacterium]